MKKFTVQFFGVVMVAVISAGCSKNTAIKPNEIYQGYPCRNTCSDFKLGFDTAQNKGLTHRDDCDQFNDKLKLGCLSYIHEYIVEHEGTAIAFDSVGTSK